MRRPRDLVRMLLAGALIAQGCGPRVLSFSTDEDGAPTDQVPGQQPIGAAGSGASEADGGADGDADSGADPDPDGGKKKEHTIGNANLP